MVRNGWLREQVLRHTVYPKKYAHGFCFAVLYCGYTLTNFPISIRLTSLALWQSNDCPSASKATLMNMDKYFMWTHYERLHNHNKANTTKPRAYFLGYTVRLRNESGCRNNICRADMNINNLKMKTFQCCKTKVNVTGLQNVLHTERFVILTVPWIPIWNASLKYRTYLWLAMLLWQFN